MKLMKMFIWKLEVLFCVVLNLHSNCAYEEWINKNVTNISNGFGYLKLLKDFKIIPERDIVIRKKMKECVYIFYFYKEY